MHSKIVFSSTKFTILINFFFQKWNKIMTLDVMTKNVVNWDKIFSWRMVHYKLSTSARNSQLHVLQALGLFVKNYEIISPNINLAIMKICRNLGDLQIINMHDWAVFYFLLLDIYLNEPLLFCSRDMKRLVYGG